MGASKPPTRKRVRESFQVISLVYGCLARSLLHRGLSLILPEAILLAQQPRYHLQSPREYILHRQ
jgi:hypothetical protein